MKEKLIKRLLAAALLFVTFSLFAARYKVEGYVRDSDDNPITLMTIREDGTANGTTTDDDGHFVLYVQGPNSIIVFSAPGYMEYRISASAFNSSQNHNIVIMSEYGE